MDEAAGVPLSTAESLLARCARRPLLFLTLLALLCWLPGLLALPPLDRDESRFAQASRQMIETGDLVDIRYASGPRYNKPIGIYWLQAAATRLTGSGAYDVIWTYRLPSLLGGLFALFFAYWCAAAFAPPATALLGAALLGATVLLAVESEIATTDAVLLAAILAAQGVALRTYLAAREVGRKPPGFVLLMAGWVAIGIGVLVKGPVILAVLGVTVLCISLWDRDGKWLRATRPLIGFAVAAALVAPWAIAIGIESHGAFYAQSLGHDFGAKILGGQESHGAPPGYYLAFVSLTFWPAILFLGPGLDSAIRARMRPAIRYLLAWAGATWFMFEIVPTKLPHYILPAYPALAFLAALWVTRESGDATVGRQRILRSLAGVQFVAVLAALVAAVLILPGRYGGVVPAWVAIGAGVALVSGLGGALCFARGQQVAAALCAAVSALLFYAMFVLGVAPQLRDVWLSPRAAALITKDRRPGDPPVVLAGYVEPSLVFLLGNRTRIETGISAARLSAAEGGLALVDDFERMKFLRTLTSLGAAAIVVDRLDGLDYSRGRKEHITFYRVTQARQLVIPPED
jgi:4-amino-4-deoxy-L-arabinose transferase-like glycosyltransferase